MTLQLNLAGVGSAVPSPAIAATAKLCRPGATLP